MSGRGSRYLAGLSVAAVGLVAGGWLALTPYAFGFDGRERLTAWLTGAAVAVVSAVMLTCWTVLWRRRLRSDGVLGPVRSRKWRRSRRRQARAERLVKATRRRELPVAPDPAQVLTDLRELLTPLLADHSLLTDQVVMHDPPSAPPAPAASAPPAPPASASSAPAPPASLASASSASSAPASSASSASAAPAPASSAPSAPAPSAPASSAPSAPSAPPIPAHGCDNQPPITGSLSQPAAGAVPEMTVNGDANHTVQAPGQVRGPRSASFLTAPVPELTGRHAVVGPVNGLIRGAELLTVGSGEEESW